MQPTKEPARKQVMKSINLSLLQIVILLHHHGTEGSWASSHIAKATNSTAKWTKSSLRAHMKSSKSFWSPSSSSKGTKSSSCKRPLQVGAYYYPWYGNDFHVDGYLRRELVPPQYPVLGEYNDQDPAVLAQHLAWSRRANIGLWAVSWWGAGTRTDETIRQYILPHKELFDMKIAIHFETRGLTDEYTNFDHIGSDIKYLAETYFHHPNYLSVAGRPVLFVYEAGMLYLVGKLEQVITAMRQAADDEGYNIYIVGDAAYGQPSPEQVEALPLIDALTCYDGYYGMGATGYAGQEAIDQFYGSQAQWSAVSHAQGVSFVPVATPGFNDKAVREGNAALSRRLTNESRFGSLFYAMLEQSIELVDDSTGRTLMIVSFNEWHEDTQIEPVARAVATREDSSGQQNFTDGFAYEGYGKKYLNILRRATRGC